MKSRELNAAQFFVLSTIFTALIPANLMANPAGGRSAFESSANEAEDRIGREDGFSGVILVAHDNQVLLRRAYGLADRERNIPNTPGTKFPLESVTKQFTAAAVLLLVQDGRLSLTDPMAKYDPACPPAWKDITIAQLLTHSSGIDDNSVNFQSYFIVQAANAPLAFPPDKDFLYSNAGYGLLTAVIENVSGRSYADFLRSRIFVPLGMHDSGYGEIPGDAVKGYIRHASATPGHDEWQSGTAARLEAHGGFGGLYSTLDDMLIWSRALQSDKLISPASRQAMFTDYSHGYGFGWRFATKFDRKLIWHTGNDQNAGFASIFDYFPQEGLTVVALTNNFGLTNALATLTVGGKPTTFSATAAREAVEQVESLYFTGKSASMAKTSN